MNIKIKASGLELTDAVYDYVVKRVSSLEKFTKRNLRAYVEVGKASTHHKSGDVFKAEITLGGYGKDFYAESQKEDLYSAIDEVQDQMARELLTHKTKKQSLFKRGAIRVKNMIKGLGNQSEERNAL
jgi:ribosomal subunit interface protein